MAQLISVGGFVIELVEQDMCGMKRLAIIGMATEAMLRNAKFRWTDITIVLRGWEWKRHQLTSDRFFEQICIDAYVSFGISQQHID